MKNIKRIIPFIIAALLAAMIALSISPVVQSRADFGDFGGDVDFGGGDFDFDFGGGDYDFNWGGSSDGSGSLFFFPSCFGLSRSFSNMVSYLIIIAIILLILYGRSKGRKKNAANRPAGAAPTSQASLNPMSTFAQVDPQFDSGAFSEKLSNLYVQMQNGWTAKDISSLRPYFTDAYFTQMERQLNSYRMQNKTNYVEKIAVLGAELRGWKQEGGQDHIIVNMRTRIVDYTLDDNTGKLLSGSQSAEKFMVYEWDLCRSTGKKSGAGSGVSRTVCPSCGAPVDINVSARCEYCGTVLTSATFDWAICGIKGISQTTGTR